MNVTPAIIERIKAHAIAEYPKESCGLIAAGAYHPCQNIAADPVEGFDIDRRSWLEFGTVEAVVHSHTFTEGRDPTADDVVELDCPSEDDMRSQMETAVPWIIVSTDGQVCLEPFAFGDQVPIPPMKGRKFRHGVLDCGSCVRDMFRLGRDALERQGFAAWPFEPQPKFPNFPRGFGWWKTGQDLYRDHFAEAGFVDLGKTTDLRIGDVLLGRFRSEVPNHAAVYIGNGLVMHHLQNEVSRTHPVGLWFRYFVTTCLRYGA